MTRSDELPVPPHFDPTRVGEVWRVEYQRLADRAAEWAAEQRVRPAAADTVRVCLMAVDTQNTFCIPGFDLFVAGRSGNGAVEDSTRLCRFIYRNLSRITEIVATMDTHLAMQIFHPLFLVDDRGRHPRPMTSITAEDVLAGRWKINPAVSSALPGHSYTDLQKHLLHYCRQLAETGKYTLMVWPYHAMLGGIGHALVPAIEEACFFHAVARQSQTVFEMKGNNPLTEHYSVLGPKVLETASGAPLGRKNTGFIDRLIGFDAVVIAGEAKSHCVAWTIEDLLDGIEPELARKVYLLEDCTSPVVIEGVVDFTEQADEAFRDFARRGMHIVRSTDAVADWPGLPAA